MNIVESKRYLVITEVVRQELERRGLIPEPEQYGFSYILQAKLAIIEALGLVSDDQARTDLACYGTSMAFIDNNGVTTRVPVSEWSSIKKPG